MKKIMVVLSLVLVVSCMEKEKSTANEQGNFAHTVYFWLNNPDNMVERDAFEASLTNFLDNSEYIQTMHVGVPAATGQRDVVDASYTYSLLLTFKDKAAQDKYQDDVVHKQFIEESSYLWSKVVVYDSENILK
jgi:hypothetical protein